MPTTFNVISLGIGPDMDTLEGNEVAENDDLLRGLTFGSASAPLRENIVEFSPGSTGFSGGETSNSYDADNSFGDDTFSIDGGPDQIMDMTMVYNATLTYTDGTTDTITAVVFQDTAGNLYLAPESVQNSDQDALEAKAIRSLTLGNEITISGEGYSLGANRDFANFVCFTPGTTILTQEGETPIERLRVGDLVVTMDHGLQPLIWIGSRSLIFDQHNTRQKPIEIKRNAFGEGLPFKDLRVSPQHRILLSKGLPGTDEVLAPAKGLTELPYLRVMHGKKQETYISLLLQNHEIVFTNGLPCESFLPGPNALAMVGPTYRLQLLHLFPRLAWDPEAGYGKPARAILNCKQARTVLRQSLQVRSGSNLPKASTFAIEKAETSLSIPCD